ncbi:MAG: MFS transporter [Acidithiobacillales bacterium SG8_45]|jgi:UMF1 family MFS transporter|nr:MAG: MFS transporter [Acidithiobacillales bacterium SG8_45]
MYDFANSGYTTVVLTAIFNAYFVGVIAAGAGHGGATFLWTIAMAIANGLVLMTAPIVGAMADFGAHKKRFLAVTTLGCIAFTASLALIQPGEILWAILLVVAATIMFSAGENIIAAFLPEISPPDDMGRISGYGWSLGYFGGLLVLAMCLAYVSWAEAKGQTASQYVPVTMLITAAMFALAALPTFIWLRERAVKSRLPEGEHFLFIGFKRVMETWHEARHYHDLFRFLLTLAIFQSGIYTVIVLAAIYAQQVMGFTTRDTVMMILVVNVTAAIGAFFFGRLQDRFGSVNTLTVILLLWIAALVTAYASTDRTTFWVVANMIGLALGSSQSASRALIGQFSPPGRSAEFFGLWGLAVKLAAILGPLSYGLITWLTDGNHRVAILSTNAFFIVGLFLLRSVNEKRGRIAADTPATS